MSNLTQFAPFVSGGLKSYQTGYVDGNGSNGTGQDYVFFDITVSSVNTSKTVTDFTGSGNQGGASMFYSADQAARAYRIYTSRLTSATNLRLANNAGLLGFSSVNIGGRWQLAEAN